MTSTFATTVVSTHHRVELNFADGPVITDEYETPTKVTSLRINYVNRQPTAVSFDSESNLYFMQPSDLDKPENWPGWLRDLVEQHRPSA